MAIRAYSIFQAFIHKVHKVNKVNVNVKCTEYGTFGRFDILEASHMMILYVSVFICKTCYQTQCTNSILIFIALSTMVNRLTNVV